MKLLDTSILVEIDRGKNMKKIKKLESEGRHAISQVTVTEIFQGLEYKHKNQDERYRQDRKDIEKLLSRFKVLQIDNTVSIQTAKIRSGLKNKGSQVNDLHDTYIAATAKTEDLTLVTKNIDHFKNIEGLKTMKWSKY